MELIKKIKAAETQAQQIIEQAKSEAAKQAEQGRLGRNQQLEQAEQERKKAIEKALSAAESEGLAEVGELKTKAEKTCEHLRKKTAGKTVSAVAKVMDYLKG